MKLRLFAFDKKRQYGSYLDFKLSLLLFPFRINQKKIIVNKKYEKKSLKYWIEMSQVFKEGKEV
jgi:hypothetical protein